MLPRGRPKKGMTYNATQQRWEPIPGAQQAKYYQKKKEEYRVRVCQPQTHISQLHRRYEVEESSRILHDAPLTSPVVEQSPPPALSAKAIAEQVRINKLRQQWDTAKSIAKNNPKCNVYALDSDGNFFNARDATVDPYSQLKKKHADKERFYMKKILVTGIVYGPSKKYDLEAGEWEERDDIMKFVKVKY